MNIQQATTTHGCPGQPLITQYIFNNYIFYIMLPFSTSCTLPHHFIFELLFLCFVYLLLFDLIVCFLVITCLCIYYLFILFYLFFFLLFKLRLYGKGI